MRLRDILPIVVSLLVFVSTSLSAQDVRSRVMIGLGVGAETIRCSTCTTSRDGVLGFTIEAGAWPSESMWAVVRFSRWAVVNFADGADHASQFIGTVVGYQINKPFAVYAGAGRNMENHYSAGGVKSSGIALLTGVEVVAGNATGLGARFNIEIIQSVSGMRTTDCMRAPPDKLSRNARSNH